MLIRRSIHWNALRSSGWMTSVPVTSWMARDKVIQGNNVRTEGVLRKESTCFWLSGLRGCQEWALAARNDVSKQRALGLSPSITSAGPHSSLLPWDLIKQVSTLASCSDISSPIQKCNHSTQCLLSGSKVCSPELLIIRKMVQECVVFQMKVKLKCYWL